MGKWGDAILAGAGVGLSILGTAAKGALLGGAATVGGAALGGWGLGRAIGKAYTDKKLSQEWYDMRYMHRDPAAWKRLTGTRHPNEIVQDLRNEIYKAQRQAARQSPDGEGPQQPRRIIRTPPIEIEGRVPSSGGSRRSPSPRVMRFPPEVIEVPVPSIGESDRSYLRDLWEVGQIEQPWLRDIAWQLAEGTYQAPYIDEVDPLGLDGLAELEYDPEFVEESGLPELRYEPDFVQEWGLPELEYDPDLSQEWGLPELEYDPDYFSGPDLPELRYDPDWIEEYDFPGLEYDPGYGPGLNMPELEFGPAPILQPFDFDAIPPLTPEGPSEGGFVHRLLGSFSAGGDEGLDLPGLDFGGVGDNFMAPSLGNSDFGHDFLPDMSFAPDPGPRPGFGGSLLGGIGSALGFGGGAPDALPSPGSDFGGLSLGDSGGGLLDRFRGSTPGFQQDNAWDAGPQLFGLGAAPSLQDSGPGLFGGGALDFGGPQFGLSSPPGQMPGSLNALSSFNAPAPMSPSPAGFPGAGGFGGFGMGR